MSKSIARWLNLRSFHGLLLLALRYCFQLGPLPKVNPNENQGLNPYDTFHGGDLDSISVTTGGLSLHDPLAFFNVFGGYSMSDTNRRSLWGAVSLCIVVMTSNPVTAQVVGSDASDIVRRANIAMGCGVIQRDTAISIQGTLRPSSLATAMHVKIDSQGNNRLRSELDTPKERKTTVINEGHGQIHHGDGSITPLAEHNTSHQRPMHIPCLTNIALPPGQIDAVFVRSETTGSETLDVVDLELKARPREKHAASRMKNTVWISRSTGYVVKLEYVNAAEQDANDTQLVDVEYTNYQVADGLAVPFHQITRAGKLTLDLQIDSIQLNAQAANFNLR